MPRPRYSPEFIQFVQNLEGFSPTAYRDGRQWSVGYGTVGQRGQEISQPAAYQSLITELNQAAAAVDRSIANYGADLTDAQREALISYAFNAGPGRANTAIRLAAQNGWDGAVDNMGGILSRNPADQQGMINRRRQEAAWAMRDQGTENFSQVDPSAAGLEDGVYNPTDLVAYGPGDSPDLSNFWADRWIDQEFSVLPESDFGPFNPAPNYNPTDLSQGGMAGSPLDVWSQMTDWYSPPGGGDTYNPSDLSQGGAAGAPWNVWSQPSSFYEPPGGGYNYNPSELGPAGAAGDPWNVWSNPVDFYSPPGGGDTYNPSDLSQGGAAGDPWSVWSSPVDSYSPPGGGDTYNPSDLSQGGAAGDPWSVWADHSTGAVAGNAAPAPAPDPFSYHGSVGPIYDAVPVSNIVDYQYGAATMNPYGGQAGTVPTTPGSNYYQLVQAAMAGVPGAASSLAHSFGQMVAGSYQAQAEPVITGLTHEGMGDYAMSGRQHPNNPAYWQYHARHPTGAALWAARFGDGGPADDTRPLTSGRLDVVHLGN